MPRRPDRAAGFTLIEVLVAFAIAAMGLAALMQVFATGLRSAATSEEYARATMLAETRLAGIGVEQAVDPGETFGAYDNGYRWRVVITPYDEPDMDTAVAVYEVSVTVSWGKADAPGRAVTLRTLRLGPAP